MRLVALVAASGCATAPPRVATSSPDTAVALTADARATHGTLAADELAWFSFDANLGCQSLDLEVSTKAKHRALSLRARGPTGATELGRGDGRVALRFSGPVRGHYHVALGATGAATYQARLRATTTGFECGDLPPPMAVASLRPPTAPVMPPAPAGFLLAPIERWDVYAPAPLVAHLTKGYEDGVEPTRRAQLVDASGAVLPDVAVEVSGDRATTGASRASVATAVAVLVPLPPREPPPIHANVTDHWRAGGAVFAVVAAGGFAGVAPGWRGTLASAAHATLARVEVVEVSGRGSRVRITDGASLAGVLDATTATLAPP